MKRRELLRNSMLTVGGALLADRLPAFAQEGPKPDPSVKRVLAIFKCHFDAGFIDTQTNVVHRYFNEYFPHAVELTARSRQAGANRYVWTTGSWLLYEYLEQAPAGDRRKMEEAIAQGDIAWHALPFTWETEVMDPSTISAAVGISHELDRRYGRVTTGAKMTDVPGHTRGIISPIAAEGVKLLDIGVNDGSTTPDVPPLFVWKDSRGASIVVMYHHSYGGVVKVPGSDLALAVNMRGDNSGPHPPEEVEDIYDDLRKQFPNAKIVAGSLTDMANAVEPFRAKLPEVSQEIGDTWIYGIASDPLKVARYREVARLRQRWIAEGKIKQADATDLAMLRHLLLEAEHTWGTDTKTWLDFVHYTPDDLELAIYSRNFAVAEFSWDEKRQDLVDALAALPKPLHIEAHDAVRALAPVAPKLEGGTVQDAAKAIETAHYTLTMDAKTGAIHGLRNKHTGIEWASAANPLALFSYQTLSQEDYQHFIADYGQIKASWFKMDFGKPKIESFGARSQEWLPSLTSIQTAHDATGDRILAQLELRDDEATASGRVAFPGKLYLQLTLPAAEPRIEVEFSWFDKRPTRMPEAMWLTFNPKIADRKNWVLDKSGEPVSPFDVVAGGSRTLHSVNKGFSYSDAQGKFAVECIDAPLVAVGKKSPLNYSRSQPDLSSGIHSNLLNNAWGTNYVMWFGEDMKFRYVLRA